MQAGTGSGGLSWGDGLWLTGEGRRGRNEPQAGNRDSAESRRSLERRGVSGAERNAENPGRNQGELRSWEKAGNRRRNRERQAGERLNKN